MLMVDALLAPSRLFSRQEVLGRPSPVPKAPGVYAWYFRCPPGPIDPSGCHEHLGHHLLYVGISPSAPWANGRPPSRSTLRQRLQTHLGGNAYGSTLRLSLGALLAPELGIALRRVGGGSRLTFTNPGEQLLDGWMDENASVVWHPCPEPWSVEHDLLQCGLRLPLNLKGNPSVTDVALLAEVRRVAKREAEALPVVPDSGGARRRP